ncbi:MAG: SMP-30/gluconolactonase/LRE family protein [Bacteroidia bacterium]|nr:SMP-30/gluconolactonase/LRE family protein [Bacteroidia bacterium]
MYRFLLLTFFAWGIFACTPTSKEQSAQEETSSDTLSAAKSLKLENKGLASPESVVGDGQYYYVSNVGVELKPMDKDGDGFITKLDAEGNVVDEKFISGLDAPKGSAIVSGKFYVADVDKVKVFDLATKAAAGVVDFSSKGTAFLNDIAVKNNREIFVSATDIGKVFTINLDDLSVTEVATQTPVAGPNGLWWDETNNRLLIASYTGKVDGKLCAIDFTAQGNNYHPINDFGGFLDGITLLESGKLLFSDWNASGILMLDLSNGETSRVNMPVDSIKGPADFYYDAVKNEVWAPAMQENVVYIQSL